MKLDHAEHIANKLLELFKPHCEKIFIAGSIRRKKPEVGDIELVCLPKKILADDDVQDLFGQVVAKQAKPQVSPQFIKLVNKFEKVKGEPTGKYTQRIVNIFDFLKSSDMPDMLDTTIKLDLFMPDDFDYWRQAVIRTGSADWVQQNIAKGWLKNGWCGSDKGLRRTKDCERIPTPDGKGKWKCINPDAELPPSWETEKQFFEWLNLPYIEPEKRI